MKHLLLTSSFLIIISLFSSCQRVEWDEFVHEPTDDLKATILKRKAKGLEKVDLALIPNFRQYSTAYSGQTAFLIVCSKGKRDIWIAKARLSGPGAPDTTVEINKAFSVEHQIDKSEYYQARVVLFDDKNSKFKQYITKKKLLLEVFYSPTVTPSGPGKLEKESFELKLTKQKTLALPTR